MQKFELLGLYRAASLASRLIPLPGAATGPMAGLTILSPPPFCRGQPPLGDRGAALLARRNHAESIACDRANRKPAGAFF